DIDRAWRKTALKYHPDKVGADPIAKEKFYLAQIGYDILSDPTIKIIYDNARTAREQKKRQNELFEGKRRLMKEDLEMRERGVKRGREEDVGDEEKLEREVRRLAEDGKRRRNEREEMLRKEVREEEKATQKAARNEHGDGAAGSSHTMNGAQSGVADLDRTVKVRWPREGNGENIDKDRLVTLFSTFGKIENAFLMKEKKQRLGGKGKKRLVVTGVVVYHSVVSAHAAVEDAKNQAGPEWAIFDSVFWGADKEPEFVSGLISRDSAPADSTSSTPMRNGAASFMSMGNGSTSPQSTANGKGDGLRKVPSFASFSSAAFNTPNGSPFDKGLGANSPSLEEITMIRLKNAEKKRLEAELLKQDEKISAARPYICNEPGCESIEGFAYSGGLLRHQRKVHKQHGEL
ncbi:hypothetical protein MMC06_006769, partial [Schaereria dolodes]|nr:hypothetical protein [Schaereria dolodes]